MGREIQTKFVCDCGGHHAYRSRETYEPFGWLSAIETTDIEGHLQINIMKVEDMMPSQAENPDNMFFQSIECLNRWMMEKLFPPEPPPPLPVPAVAEKPTTEDDGIPF